jgi:hypothetical protein
VVKLLFSILTNVLIKNPGLCRGFFYSKILPEHLAMSFTGRQFLPILRKEEKSSTMVGTFLLELPRKVIILTEAPEDWELS